MGFFDKLFGKAAPKAPANCGKQITCEPKVVYSPLEGQAITLEEVNDGVFSSGALGPGVAVVPSVGKLYAPKDGEISMVAETKHAVGLSCEDGLELLMHIGLDTVEMNGKGFNPVVKAGDKVKAGDLLIEFDIDAIKAAGYPHVTVVLATEGADDGIETLCTMGAVAPLDPLYKAL